MSHRRDSTLRGRLARGGTALASSIVLIVVVVGVVLGSPARGAESPERPDATTERLEQDKLRMEIRRLEQEVDQQQGLLAVLLRFGPLATGIAAVVTAGVGVNRYLAEERNRRREDARHREERRRQEHREREAERHQREAASLRRFDEAFAQSVTQLGSDAERERAAGAAALRAFIKPRYSELAGDVLAVLVTNLKLDQTPAVRDVLRSGFERAIRLYTADRGESWIPRLDLSHTALPRVDLEGVDFTDMTLDVAFADLSRANLTGLDLRRLLGYAVELSEARLSRANLEEARLNAASAPGALFHGTRLVSATFRQGAHLDAAEFHQALLQSAHFEDASLRGAKFPQANVSDTFFVGATLDDVALRSLLRTREQSWRRAHFDPEVRARLEELAADPD